MLPKIRHFVNFSALKSIYHAILERHLIYWLTVLAKNANLIKRLVTASHIINTRRSNSGCLKIPSYDTKLHGRHSVNISAIYS